VNAYWGLIKRLSFSRIYFPCVLSQGFDLADARLVIASALEHTAQMHLEE
jgi:hypothetical protein